MPSILNWYREEAVIFKGGSGSGVNLSRIRSSVEPLEGGGTASGPVSFMRGADASAGTIKSGGKTRRAAKMVILDVDHPDVEEFIWCKVKEENKARVLRDAGFDMDLDGSDSFSIQYQNANNSVRVTDEFMQAVLDDADWGLTSVTTGEVLKTIRARDLWRQIAQAAWECADPGLQFDTTINRWHTAHNTGRINASNPCSEYMHLDNSACNLASINLLKYLDEDGTFDVDGYMHTIEVVFTAQEILVGRADYPTPAIAETSRKFRQLGLGYANLGALLMALGHAYDSDEGRAWAAGLTSLMTGHAYAVSARTASRLGPFEGYAANQEHMLRVLEMHRDASYQIDNDSVVPAELLTAGQVAWESAVHDGQEFGVRNSQASVLAPTGTIGLMMDCDTTGIEPDLGLVKIKKLVGGGTMSIVNQTIPRALRRMGYDSHQVGEIIDYIDVQKSILGAPHLLAEHVPVFACSMGDNTIHYEGHVRMMGAVQPFLSGAISKTVNMPEDATVEEVERLHQMSWELGLKAVAIYRDNCKVAQPLSTAKKDDKADEIAVGAARDRGGREDRREDRPQAVPPEAAAHPFGEDVRVPGRRLQGLRHGRRVRQRAAGRDLHHGVEAGLDAGWDHGRLRQVDQLRPPVRRAVARLRRGLREHEVRAGRHDRRSRRALRGLDHGLSLPAPGARVLDLRRARRARHLHDRRAHAADAAGRRRGRDRDPPGQRDRRRSEDRAVGVRARRRHAERCPRTDGRGQHARPRRHRGRAIRRCACSAACRWCAPAAATPAPAAATPAAAADRPPPSPPASGEIT